MSPASKSLRQGLPRIPGGDPWPPVQVQGTAAPEVAEVIAAPAPAAAAPAAAAPKQALRQGLPRVAGADPWPPSGTPASTATSAPKAQPSPPATMQKPTPDPTPAAVPEPAAEPARLEVSSAVAASPDSPVIRRGLPRVADGQPWPPSSFIAAPLTTPAPPTTAVPPDAEEAPAAARVVAEPAAMTQQEAAPPVKPAAVQPPATAPTQAPAPAPTTPTSTKPAKAEPKRHGPLTSKQWVLAGVLGAYCALGMATAVVLVARGITSIESVAAFIQRYPGEYHLPESAPVGVPAWLAWNHFFNFFLMVLIIRSGLLVRHQKKPPAYWSSKRSPKISINLWLHLSLDLLWIINGLVFIAVLFASGHWMRIVPTSWEVFPNALSAALQYLTLDWPTENGWVNYNSLQQLAYFITVFLAAPLAAVTGFRLSAFWPKNPALGKKYPIEAARALHFPTMLYFVVFILVHVILVFSTGALRNLNHMYAAQGSADPTQYAGNWAGLLYFALSLLVITGAWIACKPVVLASIARFFGKVSSR
ncbi:hypothetical protein AOZ07_17115 [Glutamicibacter halophytocola]|nr:hypothetical protein AOZ07_17115 [Glutamicibacter halophytocola]